MSQHRVCCCGPIDPDPIACPDHDFITECPQTTFTWTLRSGWRFKTVAVITPGPVAVIKEFRGIEEVSVTLERGPFCDGLGILPAVWCNPSFCGHQFHVENITDGTIDLWRLGIDVVIRCTLCAAVLGECEDFTIPIEINDGCWELRYTLNAVPQGFPCFGPNYETANTVYHSAGYILDVNECVPVGVGDDVWPFCRVVTAFSTPGQEVISPFVVNVQ